MKRARTCLPVMILAVIGQPGAGYAASYVAASIDAPIFGGLGTNGGAAGCTFLTSGQEDLNAEAQPPVAGVSGPCSHSYTTTTGLNSTILLTAAAQGGIGFVGADSEASWTNFGAPNFTGGNWGVTSDSEISAAGEMYLEAQVINTSLLNTLTYSIGMTITTTGEFSIYNPSDTPLFPWSGQVTSTLGGCGISFDTSHNAIGVPLEQSCTNVPFTFTLGPCATPQFPNTCPYEPIIIDLKTNAVVATNGNVTELGPGGTYGMGANFYGTSAITGIQATINGQSVDPASLDIAVNAPVEFTSSGLVVVGSPEPGTLMLFGCGLLGLLGLSRRRHGIAP